MKLFRDFWAWVPVLVLALATACSVPAPDYPEGRAEWSFNDNWKFYQGEAEGADAARFSDGDWPVVTVPHVWSIEGAFDRDKVLAFEVLGNGELLGVDNGARDSHESFQGPQRRTARGQAMAIVRATGDSGSFELKVSGEGLEPVSLKFEIE